MSSKITQEKYDPVKIERLKHFLESAAEKGRPRYYEIFVDNLKAVDKTSDPALFDEYLAYMGEDTRMVKVLLYTSTESCPRNDKFIYTVSSPAREQEEQRRQELSGVQVEERIESLLEKEREKHHLQQLQQKLQEAEEELEDAETYIKDLQEKLTQLQKSRVVQKESIGELVSLALESMLRRNAHLLSGIPIIGQELAGVVEKDNQRQQGTLVKMPTQANENGLEGKVTVERLDDTGQPALSERDRYAIEYFKYLSGTFSEAELTQLFEIISFFGRNKALLPELLEEIRESDSNAKVRA